MQEHLTPTAVAQAEAALGVKLPDAYLACLQVQNGGYIRFELPDKEPPHDSIWGIGPHFPNINEYHQALDPEAAEDDGCWSPGDCNRLVPFDGDGHWFLCLDYRDAEEPRVAFVDVEAELDLQVAATFEGYLRLLVPNYGSDILGLRHAASIDEVARSLRPLTGVDFDPANDQDNGYPVRRCKLQSGGDQEWIWLSPNQVRRGFVRTSDRRYAELKDALQGDALRLPEHPDVQVLIGCTDGIRDRLVSWCVNEGMEPVMLGKN
ncbi:SMI1/KNR4 family protein [Roseateles chitinivorans]|uniref:SMI1/KNR4 family protein n=1 Tax=Roseateles chitinivorans TaxID=2917965 RepID=UPI003D673802